MAEVDADDRGHEVRRRAPEVALVRRERRRLQSAVGRSFLIGSLLEELVGSQDDRVESERRDSTADERRDEYVADERGNQQGGAGAECSAHCRENRQDDCAEESEETVDEELLSVHDVLPLSGCQCMSDCQPSVAMSFCKFWPLLGTTVGAGWFCITGAVEVDAKPLMRAVVTTHQFLCIQVSQADSTRLRICALGSVERLGKLALQGGS